MKPFKVWLLLAGITIIVLSGIVLLPVPSLFNTQFSFGAGQLYRYKFAIVSAGLVSGNFSDANGHALNFYVFDENQYVAYLITGSATTSLLNLPPAASGSFSATLPGTGNYYFVLAHSSDNAQMMETGHLSYQIQGVTPPNLVVGTTCFIVGGVFIIVSLAKAGIGPRRRTWYMIAFGSFIPMILLLAAPPYSESGLTILPVIGLLLIPIVVWYFVGKRLAPVRRLLLAILRFNRGTECKYFFDRPHGPGVLEKDFDLTIATFGISAFIVSRTVPISPDTLTQEVASFLIYSILFLSILCVVMFPLWVYESSGLRCHNPGNGTIFVPGALVAETVKDFGGLLTFGLFALDVTKDPVVSIRMILTLLVILAPACLLAVVVFRYQIEPRLVKGLEQTGIRVAIHRHGIHLLSRELEGQAQQAPILSIESVSKKGVKISNPLPSFCKRCGTPVVQGAKYCENCGKPLPLS